MSYHLPLQKNNHGSIIVFALAAVTAMSVTAAFLTTASILELKKSSNVERAAIARYRAEAGIENSLFLLNRSFVPVDDPLDPKTLTQIKDIFGFQNNTVMGELFDCDNPPYDTTHGCSATIDKFQMLFASKQVKFGLKRDEALLLNLYEPQNKNNPPYNPYQVDELRISGLLGDGLNSEEFEVTFIVWDVSNPTAVVSLDPVKRRLTDGTDGNSTDGIAALTFPTGGGGGENPIGEMGTVTKILGIIRIRLVTPQELSGLSLQLYNNTTDSDCSIQAGSEQCIPGFIEIVSSGQDVIGGNKQALKVVSILPADQQQASDIWDYVIFSNASLSK